MSQPKDPGRYVCFIALREEMGYIHEHLVKFDTEYRSTNEFDISYNQHEYLMTSPHSRKPIVVEFYVLSEMGNLAMASKVLQEGDSNYHMAFVLGIAGTLIPDKHRLGDVVISSTAKFIGIDKVKQLAADEEFSEEEEDADRPASVEPPVGAGSAKKRYSIDRRKKIGERSWGRLRRDFVTLPRSEQKIFGYMDAVAKIAPPLIDVAPSDLGDPTDPETLAKTEKAGIRPGSILASDWVVDSEEWVQFLMERNKDPSADWYLKYGGAEGKARTRWIKSDLACVDMESYGFFKALQLLPSREIHGFSIRGISDACVGKGALDSESKNRIREIAAKNAAAVFVDFLLWVDASGQ